MERAFLIKPDIAVVIGSSSGGPQALEEILSRFDENLGAVVIVIQHLPMLFTKSMATRFNKIFALPVTQMLNGEYLENNHIYIVPGDYHFALTSPNYQTYLLKANSINKPSIDMGFVSVSEHFGSKTIGVILTGMGCDGTSGCKALKQVGGIVITQDKNTSAVYGMPKSVADQNLTDFVLPINNIAEKIITLVNAYKNKSKI